MEIIAKTEDGFIISASKKEVEAILTATIGKNGIDRIGIGTKMPAIDYAATILRMKGIKDSSYFKDVRSKIETFYDEFSNLSATIEKAID